MRRSLLILPILLILAVAILGLWLRKELEKPFYGAQTKETFVEIPRGASTAAIADLLSKAGILHSRLPFEIYLRWTKSARRLQAGEYRFSAAVTPAQVAQMLIRGDVYFLSITIPEGLTAQETVGLLAKGGVGNRDELEQSLLRTDWIRDLDPDAHNLEGYLFPETYRFGHRVSSENIIKTMVEQFRLRFARIAAEHSIPTGCNLSQIVMLASMVEKEVKTAEERPLVASVLLNRLEKRIPLACDATVIYALKLFGTYDGNLRKADLSVESPYNTYIHPGLPQGPICNPGADSLRAALNPAKTGYFYYVSRNDGTHQFSKDLHSHLQAVARFQKPLASKALTGSRHRK